MFQFLGCQRTLIGWLTFRGRKIKYRALKISTLLRKTLESSLFNQIHWDIRNSSNLNCQWTQTNLSSRLNRLTFRICKRDEEIQTNSCLDICPGLLFRLTFTEKIIRILGSTGNKIWKSTF